MWTTTLFLCGSAAAAGAVNAIAGGGTLLTFPALFAALGSNPAAAVIANATSTVALCPGSLAALYGYRREIVQCRRWVELLVWPSLIGGLAGSLLVVRLPDHYFATLVPWLILTATVLFLLQPTLSRWMGLGRPHAPARASTIAAVFIFQLLVGVYGGYFGAGIGILMLSSLALLGVGDIHHLNAVKTLLAAVMNGAAVAIFVCSGKVNWPLALAMAAAAVVGGYVGAHTARRVDKRIVRGAVVVIGLGLSGFYLYKQFAPHH